MIGSAVQTVPIEVRYCARCLEPTSRPGQNLDVSGICKPCRYVQSLDRVDWAERARQLQEIADWGRSRRTGPYDCIIGVSGGKDSLRQAMYVRDILGLRALLVCCAYPPEQIAERGTRNLSNLVAQGFDLHFSSPGPQTWKTMLRIGFRDYAQWTRSSELALFSSMPRVATAFNIPLIFLGENPALAFGAKTGGDGAEANSLRDYDTLSGASLTPWIERGIPENKLFWYRFPSDEDIERLGLRMVYLGYFIRDFDDIHNTAFAKEHLFQPREGRDADPTCTGSINPYESVDEDFVHVNQHLKSIKLGFGKVVQQVSVMVRHGAISREEALELVRCYDGKVDRNLIERFCAYLEIDVEEFEIIVEQFRNRDLWQLNNQGQWELRYAPR
ncbi:MAG: N-acetyl sugar amidotransferase [Hyphomicrobiales bacterium]